MKTQHTPVPWAIRQHEKGFVVYYTDGEIRSNTAQCYDNTVAEEHGTAEANARLIAAAPELLAALKSLIGSVSEHKEHYYDTADWEDAQDRVETAKAAIAKATQLP